MEISWKLPIYLVMIYILIYLFIGEKKRSWDTVIWLWLWYNLCTSNVLFLFSWVDEDLLMILTLKRWWWSCFPDCTLKFIYRPILSCCSIKRSPSGKNILFYWQKTFLCTFLELTSNLILLKLLGKKLYITVSYYNNSYFWLNFLNEPCILFSVYV